MRDVVIKALHWALKALGAPAEPVPPRLLTPAPLPSFKPDRSDILNAVHVDTRRWDFGPISMNGADGSFTYQPSVKTKLGECGVGDILKVGDYTIMITEITWPPSGTVAYHSGPYHVGTIQLPE